MRGVHYFRNDMWCTMMFRNEQGMHKPIKNYFREKGYDVTAEIKRIDVAGIQQKRNFVDIIGVEAKLRLSDWGDAFTKAIKAQQRCNKVYVAFPLEEFRNKENEEHLRLLHELCDIRGIGILRVTKMACEVDREARPTLRMGDYKKIIYENRERILSEKKSFDGFTEDDFHCFLSSDDDVDTEEKRRNRQIAKTKMTYLITEVFEKLQKEFPGEFKGHKVGTLSESGCWAFISAEKIEKIRPKLKNCIHFSHAIFSSGFYFRIHAEGRYNLSHRMSHPIEMIIKKMEDYPKRFLKQLRDCGLYQIEIFTKEDSYGVGTFYPDNISDIKYISHMLRNLKGKYVYFDTQIRHGTSEEIVNRRELVDKIVERTKLTKSFFDFLRK